ncbi:T9SS type A sorting domain-containing protein [Algibacter miyuki]|uniref:T9SS type A sorting domain-containing protein n=1 Tax=Algibacter miyuki TaxID=1306933 RepID=A0ABV5GUV6_9FLAO|nr:T9SS type A sorting domain-containing protein [Algibacter miyuki]MDN3664748.1 T9SS type A sorting domain-containing protein [Algibacter miyuki]
MIKASTLNIIILLFFICGNSFGQHSSHLFFESENKQVASKGSVMQKIRLEFYSKSGSSFAKELLMGFSDYTSDAYDYGYDAECNETSADDFCLVLNGMEMSIQAYAGITEDKVVPLNFESSGDHEFEIKISETMNLGEGQSVYLRDNLTQTYFDLRQDASYSFTSKAGVFNNRFEMVFQISAISLSSDIDKFTEASIRFVGRSNTLYVKTKNSNKTQLILYNMNGQVVFQQGNLSSNQLKDGVVFNGLKTGVYVVALNSENNTMVTKKIALL